MEPIKKINLMDIINRLREEAHKEEKQRKKELLKPTLPPIPETIVVFEPDSPLTELNDDYDLCQN